MEIKFYKYQATGNDFVIFDGRELTINTSENFLSKICDRRFGIGADGVVVVSEDKKSDFLVEYYNPDGSRSLCGNGSRAAVLFAREFNFIDKNETKFSAFDGIHYAEILRNDVVRLKMADVQNVSVSDYGTFVDTGSPHLVSFVEDVNTVDVFNEGRRLRYESAGEAGTNVNFVQKLDDSTCRIRTYERGVECETLSCGTGVTAVALAAALDNAQSPVKIETRGGNLEVEFKRHNDGSFTDVYLIGPAAKVFSGLYTVD